MVYFTLLYVVHLLVVCAALLLRLCTFASSGHSTRRHLSRTPIQNMRIPRLLFAAASSVPRLTPRHARWACSAGDAESAVAANLERVRAQLADAAGATSPRLVAVSKTKPVDLLREAYDAGQRDFGENYVQEIISKAPDMPEDVAWRFIGKLQSNKAKALVHGVPSLVCIETVDSAKLANKLQGAAAALDPPRATPLGVMVQVNTSPWEGSKGGVLADEAPALAEHIRDACPDLRLVGLMTIGQSGEASCFGTLRDCRDAVAASLDVSPDSLELSMGMSGDFAEAIQAGSNSVRVGSSIFGARDYPPKA